MGREEEAGKVEQVKKIATDVDWPCEVQTLFRDSNLGCKYAVSEAITWFFEREECGIVLEDDCLPHQDFFYFCENMLERYEDDKRIAMITGNNFQNGQNRGDASYYFSKYNHIWGWATWRRAWKHYQRDLLFWPAWKASDDWVKIMPDSVERRYWTVVFDRMFAGEIDTWDYSWTGSIWHHDGLTVTPNKNLVSNIGFGLDATHTSNPADALAAMSTQPLGELWHTDFIRQDVVADRYVFDHVFGGRNLRFPRIILRLPGRGMNVFYRRLKKLFSR